MKEALHPSGNNGRTKGFYDTLENHLNNNHQYALLDFFHSSLNKVPEHETLYIALLQPAIGLLVTFLESHNYVSRVRQSRTAATSRLSIIFTDGTSLNLNCIHRFQRRGQCYLSVDDLLRSRVTNGKRYVASLFFDFSYYIINQTLNHAVLQTEKMQQFEKRAREEQIESIWVSTRNFWINGYGAQHSSLTSNVKKYIHSLPMNNFNSRMAYRLNDLMGMIRGLLRFPKVALPPRENRLAPIPATTRSRRLPS
jgi:hypothetical protein